MNIDFQENEVMPLLHGTLQFILGAVCFLSEQNNICLHKLTHTLHKLTTPFWRNAKLQNYFAFYYVYILHGTRQLNHPFTHKIQSDKNESQPFFSEQNTHPHNIN